MDKGRWACASQKGSSTGSCCSKNFVEDTRYRKEPGAGVVGKLQGGKEERKRELGAKISLSTIRDWSLRAGVGLIPAWAFLYCRENSCKTWRQRVWASLCWRELLFTKIGVYYWKLESFVTQVLACWQFRMAVWLHHFVVVLVTVLKPS